LRYNPYHELIDNNGDHIFYNTKESWPRYQLQILTKDKVSETQPNRVYAHSCDLNRHPHHTNKTGEHSAKHNGNSTYLLN
jgi:hypothetical protein